MWPPVGGNAPHPGVLDAGFFPQPGRFLLELAGTGLEPHSCVDTVGSQPWAYAVANWANEMTWSRADLTRSGQFCGSGIDFACLLILPPGDAEGQDN